MSFRRGMLLLVIAAAVVGAGGCRSMNPVELVKKVLPVPLSTRVAEVESPDPDVRRRAVLDIAKHRKRHEVPKLTRLICLVARTDRDPMVRAAGARALGDVETTQEVIDTLNGLVATDKSAMVRTDAAISLGLHAHLSSVPWLSEALAADDDLDVRIAAADSLRHYKVLDAARPLVEQLGADNVALAQASWESLRYMTGQNLPRDAEPWNAYLVEADEPFAGYGDPPDLPEGENQRPRMRRTVGKFVESLFEEDPLEAELK